MKNLQDWAAVQKLRKQKKNITDISRELDMSRTTVYKLLDIVEHLNLFTVLHAFWVVEMYYLVINAIFNMNVYFDQEVIKKIPNVILKYNETFLSYFKEYNEFVCLFGTAILFCGLAVSFKGEGERRCCARSVR